MKRLFFAIIILCTAGFAVARDFDYAKFSRHLANYEYDEAKWMLNTMDKSTDMYTRNKGIYFHAKYEADSAIFYLKMVFDKNIRDDEVLTKLAEALMWTRNFRDGEFILEMVENKNTLDYQKARAVYYELKGDFYKALQLYSEVIKSEQSPYGTMGRKAHVLSWIRRFDEAIKFFDKIIAADIVGQPLKIGAMVSKARVLSWQRDFGQAQQILVNVIKTDTQNIEARFVKGQILEWQGEYKIAKDIYRDIVQIEPNNREAKVRLENLLWVR